MLLTALIVNVDVPAVVGVPEIIPEDDNESPEGNVPDVTLHVIVGEPVAVSVCLYETVLVPLDNALVVIVGGDGTWSTVKLKTIISLALPLLMNAVRVTLISEYDEVGRLQIPDADMTVSLLDTHVIILPDSPNVGNKRFDVTAVCDVLLPLITSQFKASLSVATISKSSPVTITVNVLLMPFDVVPVTVTVPGAKAWITSFALISMIPVALTIYVISVSVVVKGTNCGLISVISSTSI